MALNVTTNDPGDFGKRTGRDRDPFTKAVHDAMAKATKSAGYKATGFVTITASSKAEASKIGSAMRSWAKANKVKPGTYTVSVNSKRAVFAHKDTVAKNAAKAAAEAEGKGKS